MAKNLIEKMGGMTWVLGSFEERRENQKVEKGKGWLSFTGMAGHTFHSHKFSMFEANDKYFQIQILHG